MPRKKKAEAPKIIKATVTRRPSINPDIREQQLINDAMELADQQIIDGTASSAVITHFLKLGSSRNRDETKILQNQAKLLQAKVKSIDSNEDKVRIYDEAMRAFSEYGTHK